MYKGGPSYISPAWLHVDAASGGDEALDNRSPTTVIAKQKGYAQPGILVPNPYWGGHQPDGLLRRWAAHSTKLAARAKKLPLSQRTPKVMWRGDCRVHGGKACAFQAGNRARLLGSSLVASSISRIKKNNFFGPQEVSHCSLWTINERKNTQAAA